MKFVIFIILIAFFVDVLNKACSFHMKLILTNLLNQLFLLFWYKFNIIKQKHRQRSHKWFLPSWFLCWVLYQRVFTSKLLSIHNRWTHSIVVVFECCESITCDFVPAIWPKYAIPCYSNTLSMPVCDDNKHNKTSE